MAVFQIFPGFWPARGQIFDRARRALAIFLGVGIVIFVCIASRLIMLKFQKFGAPEFLMRSSYLKVLMPSPFQGEIPTKPIFLTFIFHNDRKSGAMGKIFPPPRVHVRQHQYRQRASAASRLGAFHSGFRYLEIPLRSVTPCGGPDGGGREGSDDRGWVPVRMHRRVGGAQLFWP